MAAYLLARVQTEDPALLKAYMTAAPPIVAKYASRFLARGGQTVTLEGPTEFRRLVIIEFPSLEQAQAYFFSPEYQAVKKLRHGVAVAEFVVVEGI
ncbi:MAG: hypothetical protein A2527_12020 [Candidatus Lambdaproteobacteria bacterium RIFOXYD2_FULL_50_16]|uniref:DUF1330 domain-containing protein n=1 Tax=Candidatus Lambdaproteobacteria bacterium RIFOXYD2_FULL_50_16 TaxID=1817772 RepID=A0A1F6GD60_9PROT|nr:MAG: hypothetical protein A2527_12020 [Candidatus Lambdaproteobacteria bacterium RIFOXYD2_FULL_50_16]